MAVDRVRAVVAVGAGGVAVVYGLIGLDVVTVVEDQGSATPAPLLVAAALFALLAVVAVRFPSRAWMIAGAVLQLVVLVGYLAVSSERTPSFEAWGIGLKLAQVALLAGCVYLAARGGRPAELRPEERLRVRLR